MRKLKYPLLVEDFKKMYKPNLRKEFGRTYRNMSFTKGYFENSNV